MFRTVRVNQRLVDWSISTTIGRLWRHWFLRLSLWETGTESKFDETSQHLEDLGGFWMTLILLICSRCFPLEELYCPLAFPFILSNSLAFSLPVSLVLLFSPHHICLTAELVFTLCLLWHPLSFLPLFCTCPLLHWPQETSCQRKLLRVSGSDPAGPLWPITRCLQPSELAVLPTLSFDSLRSCWTSCFRPKQAVQWWCCCVHL